MSVANNEVIVVCAASISISAVFNVKPSPAVIALVIVTSLPVAEVDIPVPPAIDKVSLSKSIAIVPLSELTSKSSAVTLASTYAFTDC